jgi:hypothetical protein
MKKNIDVNNQLRKYRNDLNSRHPDPVKKEMAESSMEQTAKGGKQPPAAKNAPPPAKKDEGKKSGMDSRADEEAKPLERSPSMSDSDSVIEDDEVEDFTNTFSYMRGAPLAEQLKKLLSERSRGKPGSVPPDPDFIDSISAKKTKFQSEAMMKEFERKKKTCILINGSFNHMLDIRARTQGKFAEFAANNSAKLYRTDIHWKKKANPIFNKTQKNFFARDFELMSKRRYQKVLQAI